MNNKFTILQNRYVISISGEDRKTFLQGLITNDVNKVSESQAIYAFLLSPQGRFLYDFFIVEKGEKLLVDCDSTRVDEIIQKLSFYKLRSKVEIKKEELNVVVSDEIGFVDPRNSEMGFREFVDCNKVKAVRNDDEYNLRRINLKLPDDSDLTFDKSFPLEFGFDNFNAVDYKKGCYVGQETTARTHYKGVIRKQIFLVEIVGSDKIDKGLEIENGDKKIGEILSSIFYQNKLLALALIKNIDNEGKEVTLEKLDLRAADKKINIIK
jgi:folate-binding protein YgfZ